MELFKLFGTIAIDNSEANNGIDKTTDKAEKARHKTAQAFGKIGDVAIKTGKVVASGLAIGATAMAGLATKALKLGGELEQNMGGSVAVFGDYAEKMQKEAKDAYGNMGLSASDYLATANKMGALFQGAGFSAETASDMTVKAMQRAADVASIMGIDTASAMEAIAGAAKGNFTMMDNLGVAMNDTSLQAYALSKGIEKNISDMSQQEKIGLAMEMFLEKTAYASGNYAKENETLAGSLATAKAALSNFLSGAGDANSLADALVRAGNVISANIQVMLPRLVQGLNILMDQLLPHIPTIIEALLPGIIEGAVSLLTGLVAMLPQILQILIAQLPFIVTQLASAIAQTFPVLLQTVKDLFSQIWDYIAVELLGTEADFESSFGKVKEFFEGLWAELQEIWDSFGQPIWDLIQDCVGIVHDAFAERMPEIKEFVQQCFGDIQKFWNNNLKPCFEAIGGFIKNTLAPIFKEVFEGKIKTAISNAFNFIKDIWNNVLKPVFTGITDFLTGVFTGDWKKAFEGLLSIVKGIFNGVISGVERMINGAIGALNGLIGGINGIISKAGKVLGLNISIPEIKKLSLPRLEQGGILEKGQVGLLEGNGAEAVVPLDRNHAWINAVARDMKSAGIGGQGEVLVTYMQQLIDMLADYFPQVIAASGHDIVTDDGMVLARYGPLMNAELGRISTRKDRGR